VYAAGWDGRLRAFGQDGKARWTLDLTPAMLEEEPMRAVCASTGALTLPSPRGRGEEGVPEGENLLRDAGQGRPAYNRATLKLGGTPSWMSEGKLQVKAEELTNGKTDDVATPWLHLDELFWDATAGRQVWAEIEFKQPTDVNALTVYENPKSPNSWPTEGLVQVWDDGLKRWNTAAFGVFLRGPVNTYRLGLKGATKLRYVPWNSYYRNFHTSEIEVR